MEATTGTAEGKCTRSSEQGFIPLTTDTDRLKKQEKGASMLSK